MFTPDELFVVWTLVYLSAPESFVVACRLMAEVRRRVASKATWKLDTPVLTCDLIGLKKMAGISHLMNCKLFSPHMTEHIAAIFDRLTILELTHSFLTYRGLNFLCSMQHIKSLDIQGCNVTSSTARLLGNLSSLRLLDVSDNPIGDGMVGVDLPDLVFLIANDCNIASLRFCSAFTNLEALYIGGNTMLTSLDGIQNLSKLTRLYAYQCNIDSIGVTHITKLASLKKLEVGANVLGVGATCLASLTSLTKLDVVHNNIDHYCVPYIAQLTNLVKLDIGYNTIGSTVHAFSSLTKLKKLVFDCDNEDAINQGGAESLERLLRSLSQLTHLSLRQNRLVQDVGMFSGLTNIKVLILE